MRYKVVIKNERVIFMGYGYGYGLGYGINNTPIERPVFAHDDAINFKARKEDEENRHTAIKVLAGITAVAGIAYAVKHPDKIKKILGAAGKETGKKGGASGKHSIPKMSKKWLSKFLNGEEIRSKTKVSDLLQYAKDKGITIKKGAYDFGAGKGYATEESAVKALKEKIAKETYAREAIKKSKEIAARRRSIDAFIKDEKNKKVIGKINGIINRCKNECTTPKQLLEFIRKNCHDINVSVPRHLRGKENEAKLFESILEQLRMQSIYKAMKK